LRFKRTPEIKSQQYEPLRLPPPPTPHIWGPKTVRGAQNRKISKQDSNIFVVGFPDTEVKHIQI